MVENRNGSNAPYEIWATGKHSCTLALLNGRVSPEIEANARLIAAAPDLLEALKWCADTAAPGPCRDAADAAIAKAEGKS